MGGMIQRMQMQCNSCNGEGKTFTTIKEDRNVEVHVQRGALDGHKVRVREMANEHPDTVTGDAVFVLQQQDHPVFKRMGADLFIERKISLVEALCGCELEVEHLDGRKLLIKTAPGEVVKPMRTGYNPCVAVEAPSAWEVYEDFDCPDIESVAQANTSDVDTLKTACDTQLKRKGLDVGAFVVDGEKALFKECARSAALASKKSRKGCTLYVKADPDAQSSARMMKAVQGEGMPTLRNPFVHGNLFIIFSIEFPASLSQDVQSQLKDILPPPLNSPVASEEEDGVEVHCVVDLDPVASAHSNKANMANVSHAYEEDAGESPVSGGGMPQCQQM